MVWRGEKWSKLIYDSFLHNPYLGNIRNKKPSFFVANIKLIVNPMLINRIFCTIDGHFRNPLLIVSHYLY